MFRMTHQTEVVISGVSNETVEKAKEILQRDMGKCLYIKTKSEKGKVSCIKLNLSQMNELEEEHFKIWFPSEEELLVEAKDSLGIMYGALYISEHFMGVPPFWFFSSYNRKKTEEIVIPEMEYRGNDYIVRYRGWFVNDEVLIADWGKDRTDIDIWEMVLEACLRCGGNMVIPGTDKNSRKNRATAKKMGLWLTHHHAEPLGAEMFARAFHDKEASYALNKILFHQIWREGIEEQTGQPVIWNLGFRGQGDRAFWHDDPRYQTPKERGALISSVIQEQFDLLCEYIQNPVCCTNLYGEIMELYQQGYITFPKKLIKIWADNGYGKMVSRRQGNHDPRVKALPATGDIGPHGMYYHASFYDLQASGHIAMLPNSNLFVGKELENARKCGVCEYCIVNSGNVKPHMFELNLIRAWWSGELQDDAIERGVHHINEKFVESYLLPNTKDERIKEEVLSCYDNFYDCCIPFGSEEDQKAGEQIYHYTARIFLCEWLKGNTDEPAKELIWLTKEKPFYEQVKVVYEMCKAYKRQWEALQGRYDRIAKKLPEDRRIYIKEQLGVQIQIHASGIRGLYYVCRGLLELQKHTEREVCFAVMGKALACYQEGLRMMWEVEQGEFLHFYRNDCLTNVSLTCEVIKSVYSYLRLTGEGSDFYLWERKYLTSEEDKRVCLITNFKKHLPDHVLAEKLYKVFFG